MDLAKLLQIENKVKELLGGADDCFNETAGYVIYSEPNEITINKTGKIDEPNQYFIIQFRDGAIDLVNHYGLDADSVIELLNK